MIQTLSYDTTQLRYPNPNWDSLPEWSTRKEQTARTLHSETESKKFKAMDDCITISAAHMTANA
jgi:hypothetical protein